MLKDVHLLEAALVTDEIVVALDETVRALFVEAAISVGEIKNVVWINPDRADESLYLGWKAAQNRIRRDV